MPDKKVKDLKAEAAKLDPNAPVPPHGYTMEEFNASLGDTKQVPAFIQQGIDMSKVRQVPAPPPTTSDQTRSVAYVNSANPYEVKVGMPDIYGQPILNHELTHTFQVTRNPDLGQISAPVDKSAGTVRQMYDYDGIEGLKKATSITKFNEEQQAEIVKDYKATQDKYLAKVKAGQATPADLRKMYEARQAYHPLVKQLAAMPDAKVKLQPSALDMVLNRNMPSLDLKPEAPGLPSYDTPGLGVAPADPLLGGKSQPMGTRKTFKNGKIGVWDGHGWRAQ